MSKDVVIYALSQRQRFLLPLLIGLYSCATPAKQRSDNCENFPCERGAVIRGSIHQPELSLVFTGDEFADGAVEILRVLNDNCIKGAFFLTGHFYRNPDFQSFIADFVADGHYVGAHSDEHLLYCDWANRDSLLVTKEEFLSDLESNYLQMGRFGIKKEDAPFFLPPYEWYNDSISQWTREFGLQLINYSPGTISHADYTTPEMRNYRSSSEILKSILSFEESSPSGLNGFILLSHVGVSPKRTDKFYLQLEDLLMELQGRGYHFKRIDELLEP